MDIDEKEMILRYRRKRMRRKILKVSAKEIAWHIFCLVREDCEGCNTTHLSQTHHTCLSMGKFKRLEYFDAALQRSSEATVMKTFTETLSGADLSVLCSMFYVYKILFAGLQPKILSQLRSTTTILAYLSVSISINQRIAYGRVF